MTSKLLRKANAAADERFHSQKFLKSALDHIFPDNWSFMLGELAMYCFLILVVTGIYLAFFYNTSEQLVTYHGPYVRLQGVKVPEAYQSVVDLSLSVHGGLLIRQVHHWAADLFLGAIAAHLLRIFFTGAFRKPREVNWVIGSVLLLCAIMEGFAGYSLPDDLMSGLGLRIGYSIALSIPVFGNWITYLLFGAQFPSFDINDRLYVLHVFILPLLIAGLIGVHLATIWRQKHTQFPGAGRSEKRLVGAHMFPTYTLRSVSLLLGATGVLFVLGGLFQINPIWEYGPYEPYFSSSFAQPDFYTSWVEGAMRIFPAWQLHIFGYRVAEMFWPSAFFMIATGGILISYPWLEKFWTGDYLHHNLLDRPRDRPGRTALGVAICTFYLLLLVAGGQDFVAYYLRLPENIWTYAERGMVVGVPVITGFLAWRICLGLKGVPVQPPELPEGEAASVMPPPKRYLPERAKWEAPETGEPLVARAAVAGRLHLESLAADAERLAATASSGALLDETPS
jgi:ubiquinol-cytochrome c reductase cytochrome b subunit